MMMANLYKSYISLYKLNIYYQKSAQLHLEGIVSDMCCQVHSIDFYLFLDSWHSYQESQRKLHNLMSIFNT